MASKNQVTLTFAGDSSKLESAFNKVGESARKMDGDVGKASKSVGDSADGFDKAGEAADGTYGKFDALESVGRGTTDTMSGLGEIMKGNVLQGSTDLAGGIAALADGFTGAVLPLIKLVATTGLQTVATAASTVASKAAAVASKVWAAGQWVLNAALTANPIGLVVAAIALLVVGIVIAWKKSDTFRAIVTGAFNAVWSLVKKVGAWFRDTLWPWLKGVFDKVGTAAVGLKNGLVAAFDGVVGWLKSFPGKVKSYFDGAIKGGAGILAWFKALPGKIAGFFKGVGSVISAPFKSAFAGIKQAWNNTVGGKGFSVPGWIPGLGGKDFRIPYFHTGGIVPGGLGSESLAVLRAGERVTTVGGDRGTTIVFESDGTRTGDLLVKLLKETVRVRGGNVQVVLGNG